jgi:hypothetical protein
MFDNRVLRQTYGPKSDVVTGDWRRLPNKDLYDLYSSPNRSFVIKFDTCGRRGAYKVVEGKAERKFR